MSDANKDEKKQLLQLVKQAVEKDLELREQLNVGSKFRFIRDRLTALLARVEENLTEIQKTQEQKQDVILPDETLVYVYLFNAQGNLLQTWQKMLNPAVFYEYSINRPIYANKAEIDGMIRRKPNKMQNGYLTVAIKKQDILPGEPLKDAGGNTIVKIKEGSLKPDRLISFTHNEIDYVLNEAGELIKKPSIVTE